MDSQGDRSLTQFDSIVMRDPHGKVQPEVQLTQSWLQLLENKVLSNCTAFGSLRSTVCNFGSENLLQTCFFPGTIIIFYEENGISILCYTY